MFKIKVDTKSIDKRIAEIEKSVDEMTLEIVNELGSIVKSNARGYVPVDTAALKKSIDMEVINGDEAQIGTPLDYGWIQEYGSTKQEPRSYLRPALKDAKQEANNIIKKVVKKYVK